MKKTDIKNTDTTHSIIRVLPPEISNKIAAGEVIQRPASVVKELLDNSIDSGADHIKVIIEKAGSTTIQVIDNGSGMSEEDVKLCFERHATSKIHQIDDLFRIQTLGFRGEAMASIASISQVQVKTKRIEDDHGTELEIWGGEEKGTKPIATENGTSISVSNLFYNVPARRSFLKTNSTEFRHIMRTFQYAALANTDVTFELHADGEEVYNLPKQTMVERISMLFGSPYRASLVPFDEQTSMVRIYGFVSDPKLAKKSRGEQFLFINGRPFQHRYLTHVILSLYDAWTRHGEYPFFSLFFEIDPTEVDVNVHPSKMEVKFEDERSLIQLARSVVNRALNDHFNIPEISPDQDNFLIADTRKSFDDFTFKAPQGRSTDGDNVEFSSRINTRSSNIPEGDWSSLIYNRKDEDGGLFQSQDKPEAPSDRRFWQLHNMYIVTQTRSGLCMIDQYYAHRRILFERALSATDESLPSTQQLLFAQTVELGASDFELLKELHPILQRMGFSIQLLSGNTALVSGVPSDLDIGDEQRILIPMLHQYQELGSSLKLEPRERIAIAFANRAAIPRGKKLSDEEMEAIFDQLFACKEPYKDPLQKPTIVYIPLDEIQYRFR